MSYLPPRPLPSHLRGPSLGAHAAANAAAGRSSTTGGAGGAGSGASPALVARINEKKLELENLKELRDLSAQLAGQMSMLEEKLGTLASGTEAVAMVLANWHNVLRAINMASMKIPKPKDDDAVDRSKGDVAGETKSEIPLPQTLVRIPVQQMPRSGKEGTGE